ncbi:MAG: arsenate reductase family protein [Magnetospirillum sp.]|nr:arsenate reductase family protein [Magnetospirillum sp.]
MAFVVFYEKPGCINNTRQKRLLLQSGHVVEPRDILATAWTAETLRPFFADLPVAAWFNRAAPRVKSGAVVPEDLSAEQAMTLMLADPLLIRRPLIETTGRKVCGFDETALAAWLGLAPAAAIGEDCPRDDGGNCP